MTGRYMGVDYGLQKLGVRTILSDSRRRKSEDSRVG
jgi:hypothetical protein